MTGQTVLEGKEAKIALKVNHRPQHWGKWFAKIGDGDMKETNLNIFYHFGDSLRSLEDQISIGASASNALAYLILAKEWLEAFLEDAR